MTVILLHFWKRAFVFYYMKKNHFVERSKNLAIHTNLKIIVLLHQNICVENTQT